MRKIKFRAWDGFKIIYDFWIDSKTGIPHQQWYEDMDMISGAKIMQYTGLNDKNGKEIYEGDIFKTILGWVAVVEWDEINARFLGFTLERERKILYVGREPAVEVIGNIYDNPELLTKYHKVVIV